MYSLTQCSDRFEEIVELHTLEIDSFLFVEFRTPSLPLGNYALEYNRSFELEVCNIPIYVFVLGPITYCRSLDGTKRRN